MQASMVCRTRSGTTPRESRISSSGDTAPTRPSSSSPGTGLISPYSRYASTASSTYCRLTHAQQALYSAVQEVAQKFPQNVRSRYVEAAKSLRLPYFDWAVRVRAGADSLPSSIAQQTIRIVDTDGQRKSIENPLYSFNISQIHADKGDLTRGVRNPLLCL